MQPAGVSCPACGQVNPGAARFCSNCGTQLAAPTGEEPRQTRKLVTVVFSDVTGSTELGERLDPESLSQLMARWYGRMRAVLEAHGGTVQKFIGDAVMAVFGIPAAHEDDAVRAVRAAEAMHGALEELNLELERDLGVGLSLRTGVQSGEVVAGNPALGDALVVGDAVNVAARLEQAAAPGQVLLGEATWRLARDAVTVAPRTELALKGKRQPVGAFALRSVLPHALGHARRDDTPMVGRTTELELLAWTWERVVRTRTVQLVTVLGQAGVGKTRLATEALAGLDPAAQVLSGRCLPYGEGITWWPVAEIVRQAAGITDADPPAAARDKLGRLFGDDARQPESLAGSVARLVGLERGVVSTEDALWAIRRLLALLAGRKPLAVVLDDLHWAEPTLLELIERGVDASRDVPLLVVCLARPGLLELRPGWAGGKLNATTLLLEPLSAQESRQLLEALAGAPVDDQGAVTRAAAGNPLFMEELLASLIEDGRLARSNGAWTVSGEVASIVTPPSIQALLAARLDRLDDAERAALDRASVIGQAFERSAVVALSPEPARPGVARQLAALAGRELLRPVPPRLPGDEAYEFRHLLLRDAAYNALPKATRASLHERFAAWLQTTMGERLDEYEEILGYHLEQAWRYRVALGPGAASGAGTAELAASASARLAGAGRRALARGDPHGAIKLLERAKELLAPDDLGRLRLLTDQAEGYMTAWDYPNAERALEQAAKGAERAGDAGLQAYALVGRLWVEHVGGEPDYERVRAQAREALEVLERVGDDRGTARAWYLLAVEAVQRCQVAEAEAAHRHAIELARRAGDERTLAGIQSNMALQAIWGPVPVAEGIERCERILAEAGTNRRVELSALGALAVLRAMDGQAEAARALVERTMEIGQEFAVRHVAAQIGQFAGLAMLLAGDAEAAEARLRWGYDLLEGMGDVGWRSELSADLARVLYARGRLDGAEAFALISLEISGAEDLYSHTGADGILAKVLAGKGELARAVELAEGAVAIADRTDMLNMRADARADLAEVLRLAGRPAEARAALASAIELYRAKGNRSSAEAAGRLLGATA
jgi:class 3 adenylate cyclase/tetratricopeptide (TPR) repeat protein